MKTANEEIYTTVWSHLEELRSAMIKIFLVVLCGFILTVFFYREIFTIITWPIKQTTIAETTEGLQKQQIKRERLHNKSANTIRYIPPEGTFVKGWPNSKEAPSYGYSVLPGAYLDIETFESPRQLTLFSPTEGFFTIFKVCFWSALVLTSPLWLFFVTAFIAPALRQREKILLAPFLVFSVVFLTGGGLFAYFVTIPVANTFFWSFNEQFGNNLWSLSSYLDFTLFLFVANALAFEMSLVLFFLVHLGIISYDFLVTNRRYAVVCILILGALFTPPDIISQILLSIPLMLLYEACILYARLRGCLRNSVE